jgi:hypothetical protein
MANNPIYGTREEILQSIYNDLVGIVEGDVFSITVDKVIRQFEGLSDYKEYTLAIDSGAQTQNEWLLADLVKKTFTVSIIGVKIDEGFNVDGSRTIVTTTEEFIRNVEKALLLNPKRSVNAEPKAYLSLIANTTVMYSPPTASFVIALTVTFLDVQ